MRGEIMHKETPEFLRISHLSPNHVKNVSPKRFQNEHESPVSGVLVPGKCLHNNLVQNVDVKGALKVRKMYGKAR